MPVYLNSNLIKLFVLSIGYDVSVCTCKKCSNIIKWKDSEYYFVTRKVRKPKNEWDLLRCTTVASFMNKRIYNGNEYRLRYCYKCACELFPEIPTKKFPLNPASHRAKVLFDISDEDIKVVTGAVCRRTLDTFIKKYGEVEGLKRWNIYREKLSITNTYDYKKAKYGWSILEWNDYNASRACTLDNFIKRYGKKEGLKKWDVYILKERYTCSLEYFIKEYGIEEGTLKYNNFANLRLKGGKGYSNIADECFMKLASYFKSHKIFTHALGTLEKLVGKYHIDYYDETLNIGVEFYGDFWHCNPLKYKPDLIVNGVKVKDKWEYDRKRLLYIKEYLSSISNIKPKIFIIWENTYNENSEECINNLILNIKQ